MPLGAGEARVGAWELPFVATIVTESVNGFERAFQSANVFSIGQLDINIQKDICAEPCVSAIQRAARVDQL